MKINKSTFTLALCCFLSCINPSYAFADSSTTEKAGTVLKYAIPAIAYGSTFYHDDEEGRYQFYESFAVNALATKGLKKAIDKDRPNGEDDDAFPSGHTSMAFQGASFIHQRYGLQSAIPAYIGATYVGYSRVQTDHHDLVDVLAGAGIGMLSSYTFTTSYKGNPITATPMVSADSFGLQVHYKF